MEKYAFNNGLSPTRLPKKLIMVMKLIIVLMTTCLMQVSAAGFAQKLTYVKRGATLEQIFSEIRKQTGYFVVYAEDKVDKQARLDVNFKQTQLKDVLDVVSKSQNLTYTINENNIGLKPKEQEGFLNNLIARFQSIDVRGKVVDSLGNGLAGATVSLKDGKQSTQTAANGDFYLKNVVEGAVLVVSYLGYVTKEQTVSRDFNYVQLQLSTSKLDEVQVIAYGITSKRLSTGNVTTIKADEIAKQPVNNVLLTLQGRVPNLLISPSTGDPNATIKIQLRGQNSLAARDRSGNIIQSEPLIVIDGVPVQNNIPGANFVDYTGNAPSSNSNFISAFSFINPTDIESIDVLADADATSIFGSRGGSGAILITTKRGRLGKVSVSANSSFGYSQVNGKLKLLNTQQYLEMRREAYRNDGLPVPTKQNAPLPTNYDLTVWDENANTDWQKTLLGGMGQTYNATASISGGSAMVNYLISGTFNKLGYVYPGDANYKTGTARVSISGSSPNQKMKVNLTSSFSSNKSISPSQNFAALATTLAPNAPSIYLEGNNFNWAPNPVNGFSTWPNGINPFANLLNTNSSEAKVLNTSSNLSYQFNKSITLKTSLGFSQVDFDNLGINPIAARDPADTAARGFSTRNSNQSYSWTFDPQLNYITDIGLGRLEVLLGTTLQSQKVGSQYIAASGYTSDAVLANLTSATRYDSGNTSTAYKYFGGFGRINYNWNQKYIINISGRRDGSSRFAKQNQYGNFWSLGTAWIFSSEKFVSNLTNLLSFGKIRMSYGVSGNDAIGDYQYLELYVPSSTNNATYQGLKGLQSSGATNRYYGWEELKKAEVGIDLGFFKDRILVGVSKWRTRSSNQLGKFSLPSTAGSIDIVVNQDAEIQNSGWDLSASIKPVSGNKFNWGISFNLGIQRNKILSIPLEFGNNYFFGGNILGGSTPNNSLIGKPFSGFAYVYQYAGLNPQTGVAQFLDKEGNVLSGPITGHVYDFELMDRFGKAINTNPDYSGGLSNSFSYKGFSFDFFLQFVKQIGRNPLYSLPFAPGKFQSGKGNQLVDVMDRWQHAGDLSDVQKFTQRTAFSFAYDKLSASDQAYVDASFIRLKNVSLSYVLPKKWNDKLGLQSIRTFIQGQNIFTITRYKGLDPEIQSTTSLPQLRTMTVGISASF